jgi:hypothetical protein
MARPPRKYGVNPEHVDPTQYVSTWTKADMGMAVSQGWAVFHAWTSHTPIQALIDVDWWAPLSATGETPPELRSNDEARTVVRKAVARGEVHAIKAWMCLLAHGDPVYVETHQLATWSLPGEG